MRYSLPLSAILGFCIRVHRSRYIRAYPYAIANILAMNYNG